MKNGTKFYLLNEYGKFLRTICNAGKRTFEWKSGWSELRKLKRNPDKKSRVKWVLDYRETVHVASFQGTHVVIQYDKGKVLRLKDSKSLKVIQSWCERNNYRILYYKNL